LSRSQVDEEEIGIGDHMRIIESETITETIKELCIKGACHLPADVYNRLLEAISAEDSPVSKHTLEILKENADIAASNQEPICQDTGMACIFVEIGQEVYVFPSYHLTMDKNELIKYRRTNGILQREGSLQLPANNSANNLVKLSSTKAYLSLAGLGLIYIFNPETMQKTGEINLTSLGIQDNNPDIGIMIERDGYVFAGHAD
jgi:hypothetical protein